MQQLDLCGIHKILFKLYNPVFNPNVTIGLDNIYTLGSYGSKFQTIYRGCLYWQQWKTSTVCSWYQYETCDSISSNIWQHFFEYKCYDTLLKLVSVLQSLHSIQFASWLCGIFLRNDNLVCFCILISIYIYLTLIGRCNAKQTTVKWCSKYNDCHSRQCLFENIFCTIFKHR